MHPDEDEARGPSGESLANEAAAGQPARSPAATTYEKWFGKAEGWGPAGPAAPPPQAPAAGVGALATAADVAPIQPPGLIRRWFVPIAATAAVGGMLYWWFTKKPARAHKPRRRENWPRRRMRDRGPIEED